MEINNQFKKNKKDDFKLIFFIKFILSSIFSLIFIKKTNIERDFENEWKTKGNKLIILNLYWNKKENFDQFIEFCNKKILKIY